MVLGVCYGGAVARLARVVLRLRRRVRGGSPMAARRALSCCRVFHAARMRWLRVASRQASQRARGVRPMRRHHPRVMLVVAGSLMVENVRSVLVRRV
jgi:hypothetical protein